MNTPRAATRSPYLIGGGAPTALVTPRVAAILERYADLSALRVRTRGLDPEASAVLEAVRYAAMAWRGSVTGTEVATGEELPSPSSEWLSTTQAGDLAGVGRRAITKAIAEGRLPATRVGTCYRVSREDLEH